MKNRRNGRDAALLASLPWTLAALTFAVAPHVVYLPAWVTVVFLACAAGRWQMERKRWRLPPTWLRAVLALLGFIGVYTSYESISGVGPGSALLAVMAALKLLETRQRRDQFVLLFISIFLIMASLLREQSLWSFPYLIVGLTLTMSAWLRMSSGDSASVRRTVGAGSRLVLYAAPLALAMWIFFPRIAAPFWSVPIDTGKASSGLSDRMSPGDLSSRSLSDAVAFRVDFKGTIPAAAQRYWRGLVLDRFNGRTWYGSEPGFDAGPRDGIEVSGEPVRYELTLEPTRQHWVFALDMPYRWTLEQTWMGARQQLIRAQPIDRRIVYDAVSYLQYRNGSRLSGRARTRNLNLPERSNPRTVALAHRMRAAAGSDKGYISDVLAMFHEQEFYYSLDPPPLDNDPVDRFLFETREGFCEHYASAFAVLMRAAGVPARIVLGYQGGEINPLGGYLIVRQSDAHAWTEVWLDGLGWRRIDPTAAVAPARIEDGMAGARFAGLGARWGLAAPSQLWHRLGLAWDALDSNWNEWILGYGPENQGRFMHWLGMRDPDWQKMMLTLVGVTIVLVAAVSFFLVRRYHPPKQDRAALLYRRFTRKAGLLPKLGESPDSYARRLAAAKIASCRQAENIIRHYLAARYGPPAPGSLGKLRDAVNEFRAARV